MRRLVASATILLLIACTSTAPEAPFIPVIGQTADIERWAGIWSGTVTGPQGAALLEFSIVPQPRGGGRLFLRQLAVPIELLYVRIEGDTFASAARPQFDETCRCEVYRTIHGRLEGDQIAGEIQRLENRDRTVTATFTVTRAE